LKAGLFESLQQIGVQNPTSIVDSAFQQYSDSYNKALIERAFKLLDKDLETRNSIAEAIGEAMYIPKKEAEDSIGTEIEASLEKPMKATSSSITEIGGGHVRDRIRSGQLFKRVR
jgi:hypothetical protein